MDERRSFLNTGAMRIGFLALVLTLPVSAWAADDWVPLPGSQYYLINPSSIQQKQQSGTSANVPIVGIWVKVTSPGGVPLFQLWVNCVSRQSQTYRAAPQDGWTPWTPIPPDSMEWSVWQYLCNKHNADKQ
jgi:hypothetical protein